MTETPETIAGCWDRLREEFRQLGRTLKREALGEYHRAARAIGQLLRQLLQGERREPSDEQ